MRKWIAVLVVVGALAGGVFLMKYPAAPREFAKLPVPQQNLMLYDAFWAAIDANYYDPNTLRTFQMRQLRATWRAKAETANSIQIYSDVLDQLARQFPHSHVWVRPVFTNEDLMMAAATPKTAEHFKQMGKQLAHGPGFQAVTIRRAGGTRWIVGDVLSGSPAEKAGITPGWHILKAQNTFNFHEAKVRFAGEFIAGGPGSDTIRIDVDVAALPERLPFEMRHLADAVTYVRFDLFGQVGEPDKVIAAIEAAGPRGLVLDLRGNIGGLNEDLRRIAGALLGNDVPIGTMRGRGGSEDLRANAAKHFSGPLVILIGPLSSSAAEILAAAVQDRARGKLIGRATNGSVLSAQFFPLPDGGAVTVPTHDYFRINGRRIESVGVEPDIEILPTLDDVRAGRDRVLSRALVELAGGG